MKIKPKKIITFSYDDGMIYDHRLVELFNKYRLKATFHLNSGKLGNDYFVLQNEVQKLYKGHEVSVHTVSHPNLKWKSNKRIINEIKQDKIALKGLCDYPVRGMSYPYGTHSLRIRYLAKKQGMEYGRSVRNKWSFSLPKNVMNWKPNCHDKDGFKTAVRFFNDPTARLLYIWGHSYEFNEQNRWEEFEKLCKFVSNRDDVCYMTNIEIIDYINNSKEKNNGKD